MELSVVALILALLEADHQAVKPGLTLRLCLKPNPTQLVNMRRCNKIKYEMVLETTLIQKDKQSHIRTRIGPWGEKAGSGS